MTIPPPAAAPVFELLPEEPVLLMGAGPTPIPPEVARANSVVIDHLGVTMNTVVEGLKDLARYAFQTEAEHVLGLNGPGSAAMEMGIANLVGPGSRVLAFVTGTFSERLAHMAEGVGAEVVQVHTELGHCVTPELAREALARGPFDLVTVVQGETSTGIRNPHLPELCGMARGAGALVLVDTVCTLSTMPLHMDDWGIDICVTGGQKGLASIPGVSLVAFSDRAWQALEDRPRPAPHWVLDVKRAWNFWGHHKYHYTAPSSGILALYEALRLVAEEGLEPRFARHLRCARAVEAGLEALGLELLVPEAWRLRSVMAIRRPAALNADALRARMLEEHGVQISGAFGLDIFRIGQMGEQCRPESVRRVLAALGEGLLHQGLPADPHAALAAAEGVLEG